MSSIDQSHNEDLLNNLYDAVMSPSGFQDFIEALCRAFQLKAAILMIRHVDTQEMKGLWSHGIANEWLESYALDYASEDILAHHMMTAPIAHFYASNLDIPQPERFPKVRFYREWVEPQGVAYAAGGVVLREGAWLTQVFMQRSPDHSPFGREELNQCNQLIPHIQRAIQMRQRFIELQLGKDFMSGSLDVLAMPTLLLDEYSRVVHTNTKANDVLSSDASLSIEDAHLFTSDASATRKLNLALTNAIRASHRSGIDPASVVLLPRQGHMPMMLMIAPLRLTGNLPMQGAALLFIFDPETMPVVTSDLVRQLFGLSDAEAELVVTLCGGKTLEECLWSAAHQSTQPELS